MKRFLKDDSSTLLTGLVIFACGVMVRMILVRLTAGEAPIGHTEVINVANSVVAGRGFANPYETAATGPTAHVAPVYVFLISVLAWLFPQADSFAFAVHLAAAACASAQYALLPAVAASLGVDKRAGVIAGTLGALMPVHLWLETSGVHETVLTGLTLVIAFLASGRWIRGYASSMRSGIQAGAAWGFAGLVSPAVLPSFVPLLWTQWRKQLRLPIAAALTCLIIVLPWSIRNYAVLGAPSLVRDNFGLELAVSNRDGVSPLMEPNYEDVNWPHPFTNRTEGLRMQALGEAPYYAMRTAEARRWIQSHPGEFVGLTLQRIWYFWFTPTPSRVQKVFTALLTLGGFVGLALLFRSQRRVAVWFAAMWAIYPLPFYLVQISPRYRLPIDWSFWLLAAFASVSLVGSRWPQRSTALGQRSTKQELQPGIS